MRAALLMHILRLDAAMRHDIYYFGDIMLITPRRYFAADDGIKSTKENFSSLWGKMIRGDMRRRK